MASRYIGLPEANIGESTRIEDHRQGPVEMELCLSG
jgi:hypothetical protein